MDNNKQEKIVCAAIRNWMGKSENIVLYVECPDHLTESLYQVGDIGYEKGFITNKNRFVDAKEAMKIAIKARQITSPVDLVMAMKNRIKMAKLDPEEYGGESYIKHLESEIKAIDIAKTELKPEDLY